MGLLDMTAPGMMNQTWQGSKAPAAVQCMTAQESNPARLQGTSRIPMQSHQNQRQAKKIAIQPRGAQTTITVVHKRSRGAQTTITVVHKRSRGAQTTITVVKKRSCGAQTATTDSIYSGSLYKNIDKRSPNTDTQSIYFPFLRWKRRWRWR